MLNKLIRPFSTQFGNPTGFMGRIVTSIMNVINRKLYYTVDNILKIKQSDRILDIGFGNGSLIYYLKKRYQPELICGIDISEDMVVLASKRNRLGMDDGSIKLEVGNVMNLPFADASFDKIYTINTLYFWEHPNKGFQEIKRVLKPNGLFLLVGYEKEWLDRLMYTQYGFNKYSLDEIESMIQEAGLFLQEGFCIEKNKSYCLIIKKI